MTSAPRSASTWVPKGPAPNCETASTRRPSSGGRLIDRGGGRDRRAPRARRPPPRAPPAPIAPAKPALEREIGKASCRERGEISVGAVSLKKKKKNTQTEDRRE